jgi:predicted transcriptional regulator
MTQEETLATLLEFFKALADENRLKIIGLLAQNPTSVEVLADALGLSVSTTSHHLSRLSKSGLVAARADGHYFIYSLQTEKLKDMSRHLLQEENLPALSVDTGEDAFERKVLANFLDKDGCIVSFPVQEKKFAVLLRYVLRSFEPGMRYTEKEVNVLLSHYNEDTASLRRGMIEYKLLQRESNGSAYWLTES